MDQTILIVDDDTEIRNVLIEALDSLGYKTLAAANGAEALELLRGPNHPCLILLDLMMPVMNGWQFRAQQQMDPTIASIPTVVVSADAQATRYARELGAAMCLNKPIDFDDLLRVTHQYCPALS